MEKLNDNTQLDNSSDELKDDFEETVDSPNAEEDEMERFSRECALRLEAEHLRRAEEEKIKANSDGNISVQEENTNPIEDVSENESNVDSVETVTEQEKTDAPIENDSKGENPVDSSDSGENSPEPTECADSDENISEQQKEPVYSDDSTSQLQIDSPIPSDEAISELSMDKNGVASDLSASFLPAWMRAIFSLLLVALGAVGVWMLSNNNCYLNFLDTLCYSEIALCLITAVGINASVISDRKLKMKVMRTAMWFIFLFYCLHAADVLFLGELLETKFTLGNFYEFARTNINFDIFGGLLQIHGAGMLDCAFFVIPYAFCVLILMKSYRNIFLYFLYMMFSVLVAGMCRIICMTGGISLSQCIMCLAGAAVAYVVFMLPPVQTFLRSVGLLEYVELEYDCDE